MKHYVEIAGEEVVVEILGSGENLDVRVGDADWPLAYDDVDGLGQLRLTLGHEVFAASIEGERGRYSVDIAGHVFHCQVEDERERAARAISGGVGETAELVLAAIPGIVVGVLVEAGDEVSEGQPLLVVEAMKMQNEITSPREGTVDAVDVSEGDTVAAGDCLVRFAN